VITRKGGTGVPPVIAQEWHGRPARDHAQDARATPSGTLNAYYSNEPVQTLFERQVGDKWGNTQASRL